MSEDELVFLRAKLSIARFFSDAQELLNFIGETFTNRIDNGKAISDIADVYGKEVDEQKVFATSNIVLQQQGDQAQIEAAMQ